MQPAGHTHIDCQPDEGSHGAHQSAVLRSALTDSQREGAVAVLSQPCSATTRPGQPGCPHGTDSSIYPGQAPAGCLVARRRGGSPNRFPANSELTTHRVPTGTLESKLREAGKPTAPSSVHELRASPSDRSLRKGDLTVDDECVYIYTDPPPGRSTFVINMPRPFDPMEDASGGSDY